MADIAKKLDISKAALYYHFKSKREIYKKAINKVFDNLIFSISRNSKTESSYKKLCYFIQSYLRIGLKEGILTKALMFRLSPVDAKIEKYIIQTRKRIIDLIQPLIKDLIQSRKIKQKVNSKLAAYFLIGTMDGIILHYSFLNKRINLKKSAKQIISTLL